MFHFQSSEIEGGQHESNIGAPHTTDSLGEKEKISLLCKHKKGSLISESSDAV